MLHLSMKELNKQLMTGQLTSVSLLRQTLQRMEQLSDLNVFVTHCTDDAITLAGRSDERRSKSVSVGKLEGMPIAVKDNFCVEGTKTSCGSKMLANFIAPYSATVVERSRLAGGIVVGKTNLDEFGMGSGTIDSYFGPTKNIWRSGVQYCLQDRSGSTVEAETGPLDGGGTWAVSGGSSGGSAVAVAAGAAVLALGSDTGGSVRIPAAWCGVPSLKPSYGLVSRHGLVPLVNSLDVPGMIARSVGDLETYFQVLVGRDEKDSTTVDYQLSSDALDLTSVKIGVPREYFCEGMDSEVLESVSSACYLLQHHGAEVKPASLPHTDLAVPCYSVLNPCEVASNMARYDGLEYGLRGADEASTDALYSSSRSRGFNDVVRGRILAGNYFLLRKHYEDYFVKALKVRRLILDDFVSAWEKFDYLLTPVTLSDAPSYASYVKADNRTQTAKQDHCTQPVNLAGLPAVTLPVNLSKRSLPLSVQLIGPFGSELKLLKLAEWMESHVNFPRLIVT